MGIFERYTEKARRTMVRAKHEADGFGSLEVGAEHILLALLSDPILISSTMQGVSESEIRDAISADIARREPNPLPHDLPLSTEARTAVVLATEEADKLGQTYVENEHVLLGLVLSGSTNVARLLNQKGVSAEKLRLHIRTLPKAEEALKRTRESKESPPEIEVIRAVGDLVSRGKGQEAVQLLDEYMAEPGQDRKMRMGLIGQFAAITALQIGDLKTAQRYCEERLAYAPEDPMALYSLADCLARQGLTDEARRRASDCRKAAQSRSDEVGKGVVELIEKRFPELKQGP